MNRRSDIINSDNIFISILDLDDHNNKITLTFIILLVSRIDIDTKIEEPKGLAILVIGFIQINVLLISFIIYNTTY